MSEAINMESMFRGCLSLTSLDLSGWVTSSLTNTESMFRDCISLTSTGISVGFDTSLVTSMRGMFRNCSSLITLDVSGFNTPLVTDMGSMFSGCSSLGSLDVSGFDTSQVTSMVEMFLLCSASGIDPSSWVIDKVTSFSRFLEGAELSRSVYDSLLINWQAQTVNSNLSPHFGSSQYTAGSAENARTSLINSYGWTITDGGLYAQLSGGSESFVTVSPEGSGFALEFSEGSSEAIVSVTIESLGQKEARGPPSESFSEVSSEGSGIKNGLSDSGGL